MSYQPYPNFETWALALWLGGSHLQHEHWQRRAGELLKAEPQTASEMLAAELHANYARVPALYMQVLSKAMNQVDWLAVAQALTKGAKHE